LSGKPARQLQTSWTREWEDVANPNPLPMPLQAFLIDEAQQRIKQGAFTAGSGAEDLVNYFVGQVVGSLNQVKPARRVLLEMVEECIEVDGNFCDAFNTAD
jgi:NAD(P)H-dependent flavin oxidoreductase YrpB (nitropropane dioxygenase family)